MMRLPRFRYVAPTTLADAARILADEGPGASILAGGTDLLPNMKRRQVTPRVLVSTRNIDPLRLVTGDGPGHGLTLGSGLTLAAVAADPVVRERYYGLAQAASQVASPHLRAVATLGGNLCLDTRCGYYDQSFEWRKAIDFCMKADGTTCWVATASRLCLAVSSTDSAPALISLGARVRLASRDGEREVALADLYGPDGIDYLTRRPDEIVTAILLPPADGVRSTYWKLRRRGSIDFPILGVAASLTTDPDGRVEGAQVVLGAVASRPVVTAAGEFLRGQVLSDDVIEEAARRAASAAKPMNNADLDSHWRKRVTPTFVGYALRELRGDDLTQARRRFGHQGGYEVAPG